MSPVYESVVHLGLHKTATTSLQRNLFRSASRSYFGLHGDSQWLETRKRWFPAFFDQGDIPEEAAETSFVFSDESILLRCGGLSGARGLATAIQRRFPQPKVLITIRKPSSLLVSAYFQSPRLRRIALGFKNGRPVCQTSQRFCSFSQWWERLESQPEISLSGLLRYDQLAASFRDVLGDQAVEVLPIEWIKKAPADYGDGLMRLGFSPEEANGFLNAVPENIRATKNLDKMRPWAFSLGAWATRQGWDRPLAGIAQSAAKPLIDRLVYSRGQPKQVAGAPEPALLQEIDGALGGPWRALSSRNQASAA